MVEVSQMSRTSIVRLFWGSLIALVGAVVLLAVAGILVYTSGSLVMDGPDVVGVTLNGLGWSMIGLAVFALLVMAAAGVAQIVAWIAAVLNTATLPDKTWFVVLLVVGLLGFGFVVMIAYAIAGPNDTAVTEPEDTDKPAGRQPVPA